MKNISYQSNGSVWRIYITGNETELTERFNSLFNWNAVSSYDKVSNDIWACWTSPQKMKKYFTNINLFKILDNSPDKFLGQKGGALPMAKEMAAMDLAELKREEFIEAVCLDYCTISSATAEAPDDDLKDYFITRGLKN